VRDALLLQVFKRVVRACHAIDLASSRLLPSLRGEPGFELRGTCNMCGQCCETPTIQVPRVIFYLKTVRWLILTWQRNVNGFEYLSQDRRSRTFSFRCTHWDPETKRCDSYNSRPGMCRDYPHPLLYAPNPEFLPGCGHYAMREDAHDIEASLDELGLSPEKLDEVKRRFHVHR